VTRLVQDRRNRETGTTILLYDNRDGSFDESDENGWFTVCEEHGSMCSHPTLQLAREWASEPTGWCEECQKLADGTAA
jgi:hypothetical protein